MEIFVTGFTLIAMASSVQSILHLQFVESKLGNVVLDQQRCYCIPTREYSVEPVGGFCPGGKRIDCSLDTYRTSMSCCYKPIYQIGIAFICVADGIGS